MVGRLRRHFVHQGVLALCLAVFSLLQMRGFDWRVLLMFGLPTVLAILQMRQNKSLLAEAFLICIGVASVVALIPWLFPRLGMDTKIEPNSHNNRLANLYLCIYLAWLFVVMPIYLFVGSLLAKARGGVPRLSSFTCYLGLFAVSFLWIGFLSSPIRALYLLGLWPIF
jgi:hypothetical protein